MTENEAIKVLRQPCYCDYDLSSTVENCEVSSCDKRDATRMAIQALEKQIPKKPVEKSDRYAWFCPCCDGYVRSTYTRKEIILEENVCCGRCGQKLDWND